MPTVDTASEDIDLWLYNYRAAHPDDTRAEGELFFDPTIYYPQSPYFPLRDRNGTLIDWMVSTPPHYTPPLDLSPFRTKLPS